MERARSASGARRPARIVYFLRRGVLYSAPLEVRATTLRVGPPRRITARTFAGRRQALDTFRQVRWSLSASADGRYVALDDYSASHLDTFLKTGDPGGGWIVDTRNGACHRLDGAMELTFSPEGTHVAATRVTHEKDTHRNDVGLYHIAQRRWRSLVPGAQSEGPAWSTDGTEIAVVVDHLSDRPRIQILDARTGSVRSQCKGAIGSEQLIFSPDGKTLAVLNFLSRPKMGHHFVDRRTDTILERSLDWPDRLPTELYGWSPDGAWLLCNWRVPDPDNDGDWRRDEVGLVSWKPGVARWVDVGREAVFAPDGKRLFWLHTSAKVPHAPVGSVRTTRVGPHALPNQTLLEEVTAFAVV